MVNKSRIDDAIRWIFAHDGGTEDVALSLIWVTRHLNMLNREGF
jgi:hypothetical protein